MARRLLINWMDKDAEANDDGVEGVKRAVGREDYASNINSKTKCYLYKATAMGRFQNPRIVLYSR